MTWGCYVHVPWCRARCPYCAFYVVPGSDPPDSGRFVRRVIAEGRRRSEAFDGPAATIYLGGGTPSRLSPGALATLLAGLPHHPDAEISAEANPEDVTEDWLDGALDAGIHRLSLGVQTLVAPLARRLGRGHTSPQATAAIRRVADRPLRSWSVDLIFAVPGQGLSDLDADLDRILDLGAPHVSIYGLTIEPGTRFAGARRLPRVDDDLWRTMYDRIVDRLGAAGLQRYEVSNFARTGHRCRHNQLYWTDRPYMGLGPSAHGYAPDGRRWRNPPDLQAYLSGTIPPGVEEHPTPLQAAADTLIAGMRGVDGVDVARLVRRTGHRPDPRVVQGLVDRGLLAPAADPLQLSAAAFPLADGVIERLIDALVPASASGEPCASG